MKIYLVRHGETQYNKEGRIQGDSDVPLNEQGKLQAEALATRLKDELAKSGEKVSAIYCSNLSRTIDTAKAIGEKIGVEPKPFSEIREIDLGKWEGKTPSEISTNPEIAYFDEWKKDPAKMKAPEGESLQEVESRVINFFQEVKNKHKDSDAVIIVSHGGPIGCIISNIMKTDIKDVLKIRQDNAALNVIELKDNSEYILLQNDTTHIKKQ